MRLLWCVGSFGDSVYCFCGVVDVLGWLLLCWLTPNNRSDKSVDLLPEMRHHCKALNIDVRVCSPCVE